MPPDPGYGLLTLIHERAESPLRALLMEGDRDVPGGLGLDLTRLLDQVTSSDVFAGEGPASAVDRARDKLSEFGRSLASGQGIADLRDTVREIAAKIPPGGIGRSVAGALSRQAAIGISFVTTLRNLGDPALVSKIPEGWARYFFAEKGFETVDGISIISPGHGTVSASALLEGGEGLKQLKGLVSERSAEQYVRDLIRITVEVAADTRYNDIPARYATLLDQMGDEAKQARTARWFRGFASLAESMVTSAVEEVVLGVAQFQTNPVLAAAAASYTGTVARKATQHVFLSAAEV